MKSKIIIKNLFHFLLLLMVTYSYGVIQSMVYIIHYMMGVSELENDYFYDSVGCGILIIFYGAIYLIMIIKEKQKQIPSKNIEKKQNWAIHIAYTIQVMIISFGMGGISGVWLEFANSKLNQVDIISESIESFDMTWSDMKITPYYLTFLSVVLLGPIAEELMFRGIIYRLFKEYIPIAIFISALSFGIWHQEPIQVVYTALMGVILGILYYATESLFYPILAHILNNFFSNLPPIWDTDFVNVSLYYIGLIMIYPTLVIITILYIQKYRSNKKNKI